jgi:uncharacterized protein (DUF885 family)
MPHLIRRSFLAGSAGTALGTLLPGATLAAAPRGADAALRKQLDGFVGELLVHSPEGATQLGLDHGAQAGLRGQLGHVGPAADGAAAATVRSVHERLGRISMAGLSPASRLRLESAKYALERGIEGTRFSYGGGAMAGLAGGTGPYVVSQQNGAVTQVPELLASAQPVANAADAEAYLARVAALGRVIDEETATMQADAARGVAPPRFIAETALGILKGFRATPAAQQTLVTNLAAKTAALGLQGHGASAARLVESAVYPALDRQIAALSAIAAKAGMEAGVRRLPDGEAYYDWALRLGTTTTRSPAEIHKIGLEQNAEIKARMDALLKAQGLTQGSVGERVTALNKDPRFLYPNTDAGRAELIAYLEGRIGMVREIMPKLAHMQLKAEVKVKRVPPDIEDGAGLGYMQPAPLDGSRPAIYYVNLKSTDLWPRYQLATLTAHEGIPGHTWQLAYLAEHHAEVPDFASLAGFNAFVEGWALYAEQLIDESGLYDNDPWSRLGYLQAQQFRACRLVVDTGLHAMGWSREQSVDFLCNETGKGRAAMTSETDRYCAGPGQACGYKMGHNEILRQRARVQAALGQHFDLAAFNDMVVATGGVPLELLDGVVGGWLAGKRRG